MAPRQYRLRRCDGFTFNELLVSMNLIAVAVLGYSLSTISVTRQQTVSSNSTVAIHLAQDKIEELQARPLLTDLDLCPSGGDRGMSAKLGVTGIFDRCWKIFPSSLDGNLKQIQVTVSWQDHEAHLVTLTAVTYVGGS
jgi:hypothetical protein